MAKHLYFIASVANK